MRSRTAGEERRRADLPMATGRMARRSGTITGLSNLDQAQDTRKAIPERVAFLFTDDGRPGLVRNPGAGVELPRCPAGCPPSDTPWRSRQPPYSDIVRRLFLESIAGRTDKDIRVGLHDDGIPSPSGKDWWSPSTIDTILNKPIYAGYVNWGLSSKSGDEPILVPDHHEGIVAPEEFELAHQSRAGRAKTATHPREAGTDRVMSSLLKCRKCKESLQVRPTKDPDLCYYICKTRRNETVSACDCPNIHSREFEPMFLKAVTEDILSPSNTKTIIEVVSRELEVPYEEQLSRLELIKKEILGVEKKEDRVMTAYEAGAYTVENFKKRMEPLRKQKAELNGNKATARKELNRDAVIVASPQMVIDFAKDMSKLIQHSQPKERKELLKKFIQCVWVEPGKATIVYRIPMPSDGPNPRATQTRKPPHGTAGNVREGRKDRGGKVLRQLPGGQVRERRPGTKGIASLRYVPALPVRSGRKIQGAGAPRMSMGQPAQPEGRQ